MTTTLYETLPEGRRKLHISGRKNKQYLESQDLILLYNNYVRKSLNYLMIPSTYEEIISNINLYSLIKNNDIKPVSSYQHWLENTDCPIKIEYNSEKGGKYFDVKRLNPQSGGKYNALFMVVLSNLELVFPPRSEDPEYKDLIAPTICCKVIDSLPTDADSDLVDMHNSILAMKIISDLYLTTMYLFKKEIVEPYLENINGASNRGRKNKLKIEDINIEKDDFIFKEKEIPSNKDNNSTITFKHFKMKLLMDKNNIQTVFNDNNTPKVEVKVNLDNINSYLTKGSKIMVFLNESTVSFAPTLNNTLYLSNKAFQIYFDTKHNIMGENDEYDMLRKKVMKSKNHPIVFDLNNNDCNSENEEDNDELI